MKQREIKFRAWDKEKKKITEVLVLDWQSEIIITEETHEGQIKPNFNNFILMQYTGLKDSSNPPKEIYEGDIVTGGGFLDNWQVEIDDEDFLLIKNEIKRGDKDNNIEVIGNVYENPNFLNNHEINKD